MADKVKFPKNKIMWCDSAEPDRIVMWRKAGYAARAVSKEQGSVKAQIDWLKGRKIFVHPSCLNTIKELQQWKWQKDDKLNIWMDEPVEIFDDAMAALRYGCEQQRKGSAIELLR
jgi:phage terminase large subunit